MTQTTASGKTFFTMTQEDYDKLIKACTPQPLIMLQVGMPPSQQEMANNAWIELGSRMGFDGMTVEPAREGKLSFWAVAKEPTKAQPRNPLLETGEAVKLMMGPDMVTDDMKLSEERDAKAEVMWTKAQHTENAAARRLAKITLKAAQKKEQSYDHHLQRYTLDETEAAAHFTMDPFEARLVGLALNGWWNDAISAAFAALGIPEKHDDISDWFDMTINNLNVDDEYTMEDRKAWQERMTDMISP